MSDLTIPRVTVLTGHTSPDTAYVVDDYPYGRRLRCKIRYWVHTGTTGATKGQQRMMSETTNPKQGNVFGINKPKGSTYATMMFLYLDERDHVQPYGISVYDLVGAGDVRTRSMGFYDAMDADQARQYDLMVALARRSNPTTLAAWWNMIEQLADHIRNHGDPVLDGKSWLFDDKIVAHLSDPAAYITAARALLAERGE